MDRGIGLRESLSGNPHLNLDSDKSAINYALMPAVSGKAFKGARRGFNRGPWNNSGFGLYMTSRISRNGGSFFVSSGDVGMLLTSGKQSKRYVQTALTGTAVRLSSDTALVESLQTALAKYREDGFKIQEKYKEIVSIAPSEASLMLSEDFEGRCGKREVTRFCREGKNTARSLVWTRGVASAPSANNLFAAPDVH